MSKSGIDKLSEILEEAVERMPNAGWDAIENRQPINANWITIEGDKSGLATDTCFTFAYGGIEQMQMNLFWFLHSVINQRMLHLIRTGELDNLTIRIGPDSLGGSNYNDDIDGLELKYAGEAELGV